MLLQAGLARAQQFGGQQSGGQQAPAQQDGGPPHREGGSVGVLDRGHLGTDREPAAAGAGPMSVVPGGALTPVVRNRRQQAKAERLARARRRRRRSLQAAVSLVVLFGVVAAALLVLSGETKSASTAGGPAARTQQTLLFAVAAPGAPAAATALLATDPATGESSVLLMPTDVVAAVPGSDTATLGTAFTSPNASDAVADLLGVTVDHRWVLGPVTMAGLIDRVGGVQVDVDTRVLGPPDVDGSRAVLLGPGPQRLSGVQALLYAGYLGESETPMARLPRQQRVLDALLTARPEGLAAADLGGNGKSGSDLPADQLAALLRSVARPGGPESTPSYSSLAVIQVDTGSDAPSYRIDPPAVESLVQRTLAASVPAARRGGAPTAFLLDGSGRPGAVAGARVKLLAGEIDYMGSRGTDPAATTQVFINDAEPQTVATGRRVAAALGVPASAVVVSTVAQGVASVVVVLGADLPS